MTIKSAFTNNDFKDVTPLMLAILNSDIPLVKSIIQQGVDLEIKDSFGMTPLSIAIDDGYLYGIDLSESYEISRMLIAAGAKLHIRDSVGLTPLMHAVKFNYEENIDLLLASGEDFSSEASEALYWAALGDEVNKESYLTTSLVDRLVALGADVNWQRMTDHHASPKGSTALMELIGTSSPEVIAHILANYSVDMTIKNDAGNTYLDVAKLYKGNEILEVLMCHLEQNTLNESIDHQPYPDAPMEF